MSEEQEKKAAKPYEWCATAAVRVMKAHEALADANIELGQLLRIHGLGTSPQARQHSIATTHAETAFLFDREVCDALKEFAAGTSLPVSA